METRTTHINIDVGWGAESASYTFEEEGEFKSRISIFNINFIPVKVGVAEFEITTLLQNKQIIIDKYKHKNE